MIETETDVAAGTRRIVLKPNRSMTVVQARILVTVVALAMGSIGLFFVSLGAWPVLPFSGAEWLALAYCLRLGLRQSAKREVISVTEGFVRIESGQHRPERTHEFQRAWVSLHRVRSKVPGHPSKLYFRLHGKSVEIGGFLVESEREMLALELQKVLPNFEYK